MEISTAPLRWELLLLSHPGHHVERFLEAEDARQLTFVSKLLRLSRRLPRHRPSVKVHAFPHAEAREWTAAKVHAVLSREYYASRGRRKPSQRHGRLTLAQLTVLIDQILLVSSGIRTACLIDHCRLDPDLASFLLETLDHLCVLSSHDDVAALFLGGNAFFVSVPLFLQDKALEIASDFRDLLVVNAAASLETPTLAPTLPRVVSSDNSSHDKPQLVDLLTDTMLSLCKALLDARCAEPPRRVVEWEPCSQLSRTAIAGMILCYPVVYDVSGDSEPGVVDGACSDWVEQENCLAMCPLVVVQTSLSVLEDPELPLQEFSVPQHLLELQRPAHSPFSRRPPSRLAVLKAACRRRMHRALLASSFQHVAPSLHLELDVEQRTLARVAL